MVLTRAQKRCLAESSNLLHHRGILQHILSYVGPGHWFFLSTVSSLWQDLYASLVSKVMQKSDVFGVQTAIADFTCLPQMTLYSSVFASASRMRLAHEYGVDCSSDIFTRAAGRYGTVPIVVLARELGMEYTRATIVGAAEGNQLPVLQFLHAEGCPWDARVTVAAARRGDLDILRWTRAHGCDWVNTTIMSEAASSGNVDMTA
jgi:hypothetical protein